MTNKSLHLKITTPDGILYEDDISEITAPGKEGYFGIELDHTPFLTSISPGVLTVYKKKSKTEFSIHAGFVIVDNNLIKIVTNRIEEPEQINISRAKKAKQRAEKRLREQNEETDLRRAETSLRRAIARLKIN